MLILSVLGSAILSKTTPNGAPIIAAITNGAISLRGKFAQSPFIRGIIGLVDAFGLGVRSLMYSASIAEGEEAEYEARLEWGSIFVSLGVGIGIFFVLP